LTIGMYHMTAPQVVEQIEQIAGRKGTRLTLTLDRQRGDAKDPDDTGGKTKDKDIPERDTLENLEAIAGDRFEWAPASLGKSGLFPTAYHIKVAVWSKIADGSEKPKRFWLSSGNWQSSNQAPVDRPWKDTSNVERSEVDGYNREWHAIVEHAGLAETFRNHLLQDYEDNSKAAELERPVAVIFDLLVPVAPVEEARRAPIFEAFEPLHIENQTVRVLPLLTPDNYPEIIVDLIANAKHRVLVENQSFSLWKDIESTPEHFLAIAAALRERQKKGLDVRIIFRSGYGKERMTLRQLKAFGFKADGKHIRYFDTCHTKGIVIDDEIVILGSQNWTAAGTGPNRDASLVIWHKDANAYFAKIFEYDWRQIEANRARTDEGMSRIRLVGTRDESPAPPGYRRISLAEFLGET
jgi:hypothetical protein